MLKTACGNGFPLNIPSVIPESGGSGGTSDYSELSNKPSINSVTLSGNKTAADLGLASADIEDLIPEDASSSNKLATAADLPDIATTSAPGIVQPDGTTITVADGVISAVGGGGSIALVKKIELSKSDFTSAASDYYQSVTDYTDIYDSIKDKTLLFVAYIKYASGSTLKDIAWNTAIIPPGYLENVAEFSVFRMSGLMAGYSGNIQSASTRKWIAAGLNTTAYNGWTNNSDKLVIELYTL